MVSPTRRLNGHAAVPYMYLKVVYTTCTCSFIKPDPVPCYEPHVRHFLFFWPARVNIIGGSLLLVLQVNTMLH